MVMALRCPEPGNCQLGNWIVMLPLTTSQVRRHLGLSVSTPSSTDFACSIGQQRARAWQVRSGS